MPIEVILPKVDMDMSHGKIADWHKGEGDAVIQGEALFDIETDKAAMEVESPGTGTLHYVTANQGDEVPIGQTVAWIFEEGEEIVSPDISKPLLETRQQEIDASPVDLPDSALKTNSHIKSGSIRATPLARNIAKRLGLDLKFVNGSGPRGRITRNDVEAKASILAISSGYNQSNNVCIETSTEKIVNNLGLAYTKIQVSKMRSVIASRLTESKRTIPHFYLTADIEIDALMKLRSQMNSVLEESSSRKISVNDLLIKACAASLTNVPETNVSWDGDSIVKYHDAHISVAVSVDGGLLTPVIRCAQSKDIQIISAEMADLANRARSSKLSSSECQGGSFSLSNLGMFGVKSFSAIINPPESMVLAVGQGKRQFIPDIDGKPKVATIMSVCLSCDHRVVDGALGAEWLKEFKLLLENPTSTLLN